jgi:UTP:GlnB (protein PII) uridylyltransferase
MSSQLQLSQVTADFLNSAESSEFLPEHQILKQSIENNGAHDHQKTYDHIAGVMRGMEWLFQMEFLTTTEKEKLTAYLQQKIITHSRQDLLRLLVLCHDLAKGQALISNPDGTAACPGHEILSAARVPEFQARFGLDKTEVNWVQQLVRLHDEPHHLLTLGLAKPTEQAQIISQFAAGVGDGSVELILMVYADILGGDMQTLNPPEFKARTTLCQTWLKQLVNTIA